MADIRKRKSKNGSITYQVRFSDPTTASGYGYKSFKSLKQANKFAAQKELDEQNGCLGVKSKPVSEAIEHWLEICRTEGTDGCDPVTQCTYENYRYYAEFMTSYDWTKTTDQLTTPDIVEFRTWLIANTPSRYVARKTLAYFTGALNEMVIRGFLAANVALAVTIKDTSRYDEPITIPTEEEVLKLLSAADRLANSKDLRVAQAWIKYRPLLYLAVDCGPRPQEYLAIAHPSVLEKQIVIDRAIDGKGQKISVTKTPAGIRTLDVSSEVLDLLRHYRERHFVPNAHELLFPSKSGKWMCRKNWQRRGFNTACIEAGLTKQVEDYKTGKTKEVPKFVPYDLRHFYASMLIEYIPNLKKIQKLMGHRKFQTTMDTYGHLIEKRQDAEYDYAPRTGGVIGWL